ncbi:hypothetical protein GCM10011409_22110 [Lentibacillus populi]|uniref:Uncharacterized protein n=1 Tax=Lentibacillus populi TaxID=1827502 RepID=A0A9W5TXS3_9BACI|nr:hypothetical protein [Lentibacillus populi]GGB44113.1 hypothetical protein GCM10011409_22110 [Lentibacillus populi]
MTNLTVGEWLKQNKLTDNDINFIETLLTFTSTLESPLVKTEDINNKINTLFPEKKVEIRGNFTYKAFKEILNENEISVNLGELLNRYHSQGICKNHCERLLKENDDIN